MPRMIEAQTDRARLLAGQAQQDLDRARQATCPAASLHAAALAVRRVVLAAIEALPGRLQEAVAGIHDDTAAHYALAEKAHQVLAEVGEQAERAATALPEFGARFRRGARPRDLLTVSQWADRHRMLTSGTNAPGPWRTAMTPYLRDIMDDLSEHSPARLVVFEKSAGVGGTEAMFNWIAYCMHHLGNRDMMVVLPSLELRDRSFNPRLSKVIKQSPALADLVRSASRSSANRADILEYGSDCRIIKAGANSADSLRSDHLPYVICDEVDAYKWDVGGEGDPMTLIENRQRTFTRAKTLLISTPTNDGLSRIDDAYRRSDRRRYHVRCPDCGTYHHLQFRNLRWATAQSLDGESATEQKVVTAAWMVCPECGVEIREGSKPQMLESGRWIAERPAIKLIRGYHINALYAPVGLGLTWIKIAQKWLDVQSDTAGLKAFINTYLGEVWREEGDGADANALIARVEQWDPEQILATVRPLRVVAGVDVQKDRLEATVAAIGEGEQAWVLEHEILPGDTAQPAVWESLAEFLADWRVRAACIDAGYNTSMVQAFCSRRPWAIPTKGIPGKGRPLIEDDRKRRMRLRNRTKRGQPVEPIGVDQAKAIIYSRLRLQKPGPGYIHFPQTAAFDDEYFAQIAAEELRTKVRNGRPFAEWVQIRPRNEALDCMVLALAAHRLAGILQQPAQQGGQEQDKPRAVRRVARIGNAQPLR